MPGFTTHYLFGIDACRRLTSTSMHNMIRRDHSAYALGLQGPDLFFYYLPSYLMHRKNIGDLAHRKDTVQFFANLLQSRKLFAGKKHIPKCLTILRRKFFLIPPLDSLRIDSVHAAMPKRTNVHALTSKTL